MNSFVPSWIPGIRPRAEARSPSPSSLRRFVASSLFLLLLAGCASTEPLGRWEGPPQLASIQTQEWTFGEDRAQAIQTQHYRIFTTIQDPEVLELIPQVMEGAYSFYTQVAAGVPLSQRPMDCFIFRWRTEWDEYTRRYTGQDAKIYLQIRSGGYTMHDRYVAYYIGRQATFSVAAHEGWHQFAGRHFKGRLPPFLEEGLACMFETISWQDRLPRWNLSVNTSRAQTLRRAVDAKQLYPLRQLCSMHAGDIVGEAPERIDTFYAQSWAFARFLWEAEGGRYRPALHKWLTETANGTVHDPTRSHARALAPWNRGAVEPMIEHYLGMEIEQVEKAYLAYVRKVAHEELPAHWKS